MKPLAIAGALLLAAAIWLATHTSTLTETGTTKLFFGLWKTREVVLVAGLVWLALATLFAFKSRSALIRFALSSVALGVGWIALEAAGLMGVVDYHALMNPGSKAKLGTQPVPNAEASGTTYEDLAAAWGAKSDPIPFAFKTDRYGFRNHVDRDSADIYCLGDSFLVAGLVPFEATVAARLEQSLGHPVMTLALNGLAPQQECELFRDANLVPDGRLVIQFLFEGNDLADSAVFGTAAGPSELSLRDRTLANNLILKLQDWTQPTEGFLRPRSGQIGSQRYLFRWTSAAFVGFEAEQIRIQEHLAAFRTEVEERGGRYAIVMIPSKLRVLGALCEFPEGSPLADWESHCSPMPAATLAWCGEQGIPYFDLTETLVGSANEGNIPWFPGDTHWNSIGNEVAAEALLDWSTLREWSAAKESE